MMKEEIDSGLLENVLFLNRDFRRYLLLKNGVVTAIAASLSGALFLIFSLCALAFHQSPSGSLARFLNGQLAGVYYVALAGLLSLFLRAGSNVLAVILGQIGLLASLFLSLAAQKTAWIDRLTASSFPGLAAKLKFLAIAAVFPNAITGQRSGILILGLAILALAWVVLQWAFISILELRKK